MKKSSSNASPRIIKKNKELIELCFSENRFLDAIEPSLKLIEGSPKNPSGYVSYIKAVTNNYNKYLKEEELKEVKKIYDEAYILLSKKEKDNLKNSFDDYLYDLKEVDNLKKIKKELTSKFFLRNLYNDAVTLLNQNINTINIYTKKGLRIKNSYDVVKGLFLILCLIFNLINRNYFLIVTVPFGFFGLITIFSFFEMNFVSKGKYKEEKTKYKSVINSTKEKISNIKQEVKKVRENINFLNEQKSSAISRIPELFSKEIKDVIENNEKAIAKQISDALLSSDIVKFQLLLEENTNLKSDEVIKIIDNELNYENDELTIYLNEKVLEKKNNHNEAIIMNKIKPINIIALIITLVLSVGSLIVLSNDFSEFHMFSFICALIVGFVSMIAYNINTGRHSSLTATFNDNLITTIFYSTLTYDLLYSKYVGGVTGTYYLLQVPITLIFVLIGFVLLSSTIKYGRFLKKLRS